MMKTEYKNFVDGLITHYQSETPRGQHPVPNGYVYLGSFLIGIITSIMYLAEVIKDKNVAK